MGILSSIASRLSIFAKARPLTALGIAGISGIFVGTQISRRDPDLVPQILPTSGTFFAIVKMVIIIIMIIVALAIVLWVVKKAGLRKISRKVTKS